MFNLLRRLDAALVRCAILALDPPKAKNCENGEVREILCIKLWGLGNLTVIYPLLDQLKAAFPQARITFLTFDLYRGFLDGHKALLRVRYFKFTVNIFTIMIQLIGLLKEFRRQRLDLVVNFETFNNASAVFAYLTGARIRVGLNNNYEGAFYTHPVKRIDNIHISEVYSGLLRALGISFDYAYYPFPVREREAAVARQYIKDPLGMRACLHPGTSNNFAGRRGREGYYAKLADMIISSYGIPVYFTGSRKEGAMIDRIIGQVTQKDMVFNLAGKISVLELIEFLRGSCLFISSDTGPSHLAASLSLNTVVMFGPNSPHRYRPLNANSLVLYKHLKCSPCMGNGSLTRKCGINYHCMDFSAQETFERISQRFAPALRV